MKILKPYVFFVLLIVAFLGQIKAQNADYMALLNENIFAPSNKIIVLNIWNTKFPDEIKVLNNLVEKYKNDNVVFVAITDENEDVVELFLENHIFNYEHLNGLEGEKIYNNFQTGVYKVYPMHIIIDQDGKISYKRKNAVKNIETKLIKRIDLLLENNHNNDLPISMDEVTFSKNTGKGVNP